MAFIGMYQTMTKKAAITVQVAVGGTSHPIGSHTSHLGAADPCLSPTWTLQRKDFPSNSFYVVVVVKTEDEACGGALPYYPLSKRTSPGTHCGAHAGDGAGPTPWG